MPWGGNDIANAGDGDDVISGGLGFDTLLGEGGNDTFVVAEPVQSPSGGLFETFDGGSGTDTLELRVATNPQFRFPTAFGLLSFYGFSGATVTSVEKLKFVSKAEVSISTNFTKTQFEATGINEVIGGAGRDILTLLVSGGGTFTMPSLNLTNWVSTTTPFLTGGDIVALTVTENGAPANFTLNALEGLASTQGLTGGSGNDTLNGSSGTDVLNGGGGINVLNGNAGDDWLAIVNNKQPNGTYSTLTGAGSSFNGGDGWDVLSIGGEVNFQGTMSSIEGLHCQAAYTAPGNGPGSQFASVAYFTAAQISTMPAALDLLGTGTLVIDATDRVSYNISQFDHNPGSAVTAGWGMTSTTSTMRWIM
ncbi:MAG: hypothetical protein WA842_01470 [Croceibacterium sp.]